MWNEERLTKLITDRVEESLTLDYKAAASLSKQNKKKTEITKDISAMANSDGGVVIYGIAEFQDKTQSHLPEKIDPVNRLEFSKEWLEQIINNIRPRLTGVKIYSVNLSSTINSVVFVVDVPKSKTAHQARDHRYYKRFNFESVPMEDYEIRDVMARNQHPEMQVSMELQNVAWRFIVDIWTSQRLHITIVNQGNQLAEFVRCTILIPLSLIPRTSSYRENVLHHGSKSFAEVEITNAQRDLIKLPEGQYTTGTTRFDPLLPTMQLVKTIPISKRALITGRQDLEISWKTISDNAQAMEKRTTIQELKKGICNFRFRQDTMGTHFAATCFSDIFCATYFLFDNILTKIALRLLE